jgi:hypothetical protein
MKKLSIMLVLLLAIGFASASCSGHKNNYNDFNKGYSQYNQYNYQDNYNQNSYYSNNNYNAGGLVCGPFEGIVDCITNYHNPYANGRNDVRVNRVIYYAPQTYSTDNYNQFQNNYQYHSYYSETDSQYTKVVSYHS